MKKILALLLCLSLVFSFTGCSIGGSSGLYSDLVGLSEIKQGEITSNIAISLSDENLAEGMLKFGCLMDEGSLEDFEEYAEYYEQEYDELNATLKDVPEVISIDYKGVMNEKNETQGTISVKLDKEKYELPVMITDNTTYIGTDGLVDIIYYIFELTAQDLGDIEKDSLDKAFKKALDGYDYLELTAEDMDLEEYEELMELDYTSEQLKEISKPVDKLLNTYLTPFISKAKGGHTITINVGELKSDMIEVCKLIDKNPGKFFDALADVVIAAQKAEIIESDQIDSIEDILGSLENLKESREDFIEEWKDFDFEEDIDSLFEDVEDTGIIDLLGKSSLEISIIKKGKTYSMNGKINFVVDGKSCASFSITSTLKESKVKIDDTKIKSIDMEDFEELFIEEYSNLYDLGQDYDYDFDEDYDYDEDYDLEEDEDENYIIDTPIVSSDKNFTSMLKEGSKLNAKEAVDYYNYYKTDFLNLTYSVLPELRSEEHNENIEKSYGSISLYSSDEIDDVYHDANTYMYFSDGYISAEFETSLLGKNSEKEVNAFVNHTNSLYGFKIDNKTIEDIIDNIEDNIIKEDSVHYEFEVDGIDYGIMYYEFEGYNGKPVFTLGIEANYSF